MAFSRTMILESPTEKTIIIPPNTFSLPIDMIYFLQIYDPSK